MFYTYTSIGETNENNVYDIDKLLKFDGEVFSPIKGKNNSYYYYSLFDTMTFNQYFVTKKMVLIGYHKMK